MSAASYELLLELASAVAVSEEGDDVPGMTELRHEIIRLNSEALRNRPAAAWCEHCGANTDHGSFAHEWMVPDA